MQDGSDSASLYKSFVPPALLMLYPLATSFKGAA